MVLTPKADFYVIISNFFKALGNRRYWAYFIPSLVATLFFAAVSEVTKYLFSWVEGVGWLSTLLATTGNALFTLGGFVLKLFLLTLLSPMLSYLSEKVDEQFGGFNFKFTLGQFLWALLRSIMVAIIALLVQLLFIAALALPAWFISESFYMGIILVVSSFFLGLAFFDYSLERHRVGLKQSFKWFLAKAHYCFLVGLLFNLVTFIPLQLGEHWLYYLGMAIMPVTMTIFATLLYLLPRVRGATISLEI